MTDTLAAVIGSPVRHSLSPALHNAAFRQCGLNWLFLAWEVPDAMAPAALDAMAGFNIAGLSVTMPHKTAVAAALEHLSPQAEKLNSVNCVVSDGGELHGHNTDGAGFLASLKAEADFDPQGKSCFVAGGGGAARAVVLALAESGAERVGVFNRTAERAETAAELAGKSGEVFSEAQMAAQLSDFDLVVNATSVGMDGADGTDGELPFPTDDLKDTQLVAELIYNPWETRLLKEVRAKGIQAINGFGMLVHQAAAAFELWTKLPAPTEAMAAAALAKQNPGGQT